MPSVSSVISLTIALAIHGLVIYGLSFTIEPPQPPAQSMEITLAHFATDKTPDQADYLAQENQKGSGSLDKKARPSSDLPAPFQDNIPRPVQLQQQQAQIPKSEPQISKRVTSIESKTLTPSKTVSRKPTPEKSENIPRRRINLSQEIASLEADFFKKRQAYAKKPAVHRINAASTRKSDVYYQEAWRRKVMRIGTINYPAQARQERLYGELRVAVQIRRDGSLKKVVITQSSGHKVLDDAAINIVRMAAPFSPFPPELQDHDVIEIIRTWRFEPGDNFSG